MKIIVSATVKAACKASTIKSNIFRLALSAITPENGATNKYGAKLHRDANPNINSL